MGVSETNQVVNRLKLGLTAGGVCYVNRVKFE